MKDHVEKDHLTKCYDSRVNKDKVMDLELWLKIHTTVSRQRPPKPCKLFKFFMIFVTLFKMGKHSDFHLSFFQIVGA